MEGKYVGGICLTEEPEEGSYLCGLPAVQYLRRAGGLDFAHDVTFFVGENGTGKSTLLEGIAVACGFNAEGGTRNFSFSTQATHSGLYRCLTVRRSRLPKDGFFLRAESFYNAASYLAGVYEAEYTLGLPTPYGSQPLHAQSHGESFLSLVHNRFGPHGLYLLDEPEAALSPSRQMSLLAEIHTLVQQDCQFLIATHSPILMAYPDAEILQLTGEGIAPVAYRDTEHYRITKYFLDCPEKMLAELFRP